MWKWWNKIRRKLWLRNGILGYDCDSYDRGGAWMSHSWLARQVQNAGLSKRRLVLDYKYFEIKNKLLWCYAIVWSASFQLTDSFLMRQNLLICKANAAQGLDWFLFVCFNCWAQSFQLLFYFVAPACYF